MSVRSRRPWQWLAKFMCLFTSTFATLCLLEACARVFMPQDLRFYDDRKLRRNGSDPPYLPENIPHGSNDSYIGVPVSINSYGLRGDEILVPKPPKTIRIVGVRDSIAFGYGVRLEDTFLKILEGDLNQLSTNGVRYEVLNAGVEGTGLDYYWYFLSHAAPALEPNVVIVSISLNDIMSYGSSAARPAQPKTWEKLPCPWPGVA